MSRYKWGHIECLGPAAALKALNESEDGHASDTHVIFAGLGHAEPHSAILGGQVPIVPIFHVFARFPLPHPEEYPNIVPENSQPA